MGLRIGAGFRLSRHTWIGASVPLGRLARHRGHADGNPVVGLIGLAIIYAIVKGAFG